MLGIVFGTACLFGFLWMRRHGRRGFSRGCGGPRTDGRGRGIDFALRWLFRELDTTPGQERVLRDASHSVMEKVDGFRDELERGRRDLGQALRAEVVSADNLGELLARCDSASIELRMALGEALAQVHEALEPDQRARLADLIERDGFRRHFRGPYRTAA
jgi:hypothetical protein